MKITVICLMLMTVLGRVAASQSFENIRVFPLGETPDSLYRAGYYRKVLPDAESAFAALGNLPVADTAAYARAMFRLGEIEYQAGYYDRAFPHLQDAFSLTRMFYILLG